MHCYLHWFLVLDCEGLLCVDPIDNPTKPKHLLHNRLVRMFLMIAVFPSTLKFSDDEYLVIESLNTINLFCGH